MSHAILNDKHEVIEVFDYVEWVKWFPQADRLLGKTYIGDVQISTVFLGIDHGWGDQKLWFETMVFGGEFDGYQNRYATWDEAIEGHNLAVGMVREKLK